MESDISARLAEAFEHHRAQRFELADKLYREVLARSPENADALHLLGVLTHNRGDAPAAEPLIRRAVKANPRAAEYWNNLGNVLAAQNKHMAAVEAYETAVTLKPDDPVGYMNLGAILRSQGRIDAAIEKYQRAIELRPDFAEAHLKLGIAFTLLERLDQAAQHFSQAVTLKPDYVDARASLGNVLRAQGKIDEAVEQYVKVLAAAPNFAEIHYALGLARKEQGKLHEAAECFRRAIAARRDFADAHDALGDIRAAQGRLDEARRSYRRAIEVRPDHGEALRHLALLESRMGTPGDPLARYHRAIKEQPNSPEALNNLALALIQLGKRDSAEAYIIRALEIRPDYVEALYTLGNLRYAQDRIDDAETVFRKALTMRPDYAEVHSNLGLLLKAKGRMEEAFSHLRRALEIRPDYVDAHTGLIFSLDFILTAGFAEHQAERRRWFQQHGKRFADSATPHANDRDPERKLRVGYVSADFRRHSAVYSFGPVLRHHDRSQVEVTCYSNVAVPDDFTEELRRSADRWHDVLGLTDEALTALIRKDQIDVLVDLSGHSNGNRLLVFARKPAPVQVTAWGHATGTGLPTIDCLFADPVTIPSDVRPLFAEAIHDLPCAIAYEAPNYAPAVVPAPVTTGAPLTFGSLNRLAKVSDAALTLWARVLVAVPGSRLLLKDRQLQTQAERNRIIQEFQKRGVPADRLLFDGGSAHAAHLAAYGRVDIGLDPFPQNGGISTLEALWMGVPVIARLGNSVPSRIASGILTAAGLSDWVAADDEAYIDIARRKAADVGGLVALRADLRRRLSETAVGNPRLYTQAVEEAYRALWRRWCSKGT